MFSCEYCKIFKNSFFTELIWWLLRLIIKLMLLIKLPQRINDRFNVNSKPWKFCFGSFFQWLSYWAVNSLFSTYKSNAKHFFFLILIPKRCTKNYRSCSANQIYLVGQQGVVRRCSAKNVFLNTLQKSQDKTH